jgi:hypothetical protein
LSLWLWHLLAKIQISAVRTMSHMITLYGSSDFSQVDAKITLSRGFKTPKMCHIANSILLKELGIFSS